MTVSVHTWAVARFLPAAADDGVVGLVCDVRGETGYRLDGVLLFCGVAVGGRCRFTPRDLVVRWREIERRAGLARRSVRWRDIPVRRPVPEATP